MNNHLHFLFTYVTWFPKTFHLHGIHSPFIYTLEKTGLRKKPPNEIISLFKNYRKTLLNDTETIEVQDFGAGSRVFKSHIRKVADIARHAGASQKRMHLLYQLTSYFSLKTILELGTSLGLATIALAQQKDIDVTTIEGCPETARMAGDFLKKHNTTTINKIVSPFEVALPQLSGKQYDLIYFDGNHSKEATLNYARQLLPTTHNDTLWVFDDIHWSFEMTQAWKEIQSLPGVTATIDGFWFGIVFFRKEQRKEAFQIRL